MPRQLARQSARSPIPKASARCCGRLISWSRAKSKRRPFGSPSLHSAVSLFHLSYFRALHLRYVLFHDSFAQEIRRKQSLRQDEIMEPQRIEFLAKHFLGVHTQLQQLGVTVEVGRGLAWRAERVTLHFAGGERIGQA